MKERARNKETVLYQSFFYERRNQNQRDIDLMFFHEWNNC